MRWRSERRGSRGGGGGGADAVGRGGRGARPRRTQRWRGDGRRCRVRRWRGERGRGSAPGLVSRGFLPRGKRRDWGRGSPSCVLPNVAAIFHE